MVNLAQCEFGDSLSGYALPVQDLVQTLLKLTHGLLHLISMQKLGKIFRKNTMKYKHGS